MIPSKHQKPGGKLVTFHKPHRHCVSQHYCYTKALGLMPWERFVTTYNCDYKPFSERQLQAYQAKPRTEAAPAFLSPPQTDRETWPTFHQCFYKTSNSVYGSSGCSEASVVVGSALTEARKQEVGAARETGPLLFEPERGQLHYVCGGKADMLEQQEAKDKLQQKVDVLYEEGVIVLSSHASPACCEDILRSVCGETGLQGLLHLPVTSSPMMTIQDPESWDNSAYLRGRRQHIGLKNSTFLQPTSRRCSCCAWETECPNSCCFRMQPFPQSSTQSPARVQPTVCCTETSKKPWLTEYQASYTAPWAQPQIQQSDLRHHRHARQQILYPSL